MQTLADVIERTREELPRIENHLQELTGTLLPRFDKALKMAETDGDYKAVMNGITNLLPYVLKKVKELNVYIEAAMPVQLNITIARNGERLTQAEYVKENGLYEYILPNGTNLNIDNVLQLLDDYATATGRDWKPHKAADVKQQSTTPAGGIDPQ
ncbi:TPA: hypothetical protein JG871_004246 [Enterobacter hormaechei subsp. xiangfangensis]|nr:hypothetical protein [Enterobacter hormaechei subsp. xiangfangensis]